MKNDSRETSGCCEGLCGGLYDHHLIGGLCAICRNDPRIITIDADPAEHEDVPLGIEAATLTPEMKAHVIA